MYNNKCGLGKVRNKGEIWDKKQKEARETADNFTKSIKEAYARGDIKYEDIKKLLK